MYMQLFTYQLKVQVFQTKTLWSNYFHTLRAFFIFVDFLAFYQRHLNVKVGNVTSTAVNVSWLPLNTSNLNSTEIYGYLAVCIRRGNSEILPLRVESASSSSTMVLNLKPYTNYEVKVVALLKDRVTNVTTLRSSEKTDTRTKEGGM